MNKFIRTARLSIAGFLLISSAHAADKYYAPAVKHPVQVYFGDPHVHTSISLDAAASLKRLPCGAKFRLEGGGRPASIYSATPTGWQMEKPLLLPDAGRSLEMRA